MNWKFLVREQQWQAEPEWGNYLIIIGSAISYNNPLNITWWYFIINGQGQISSNNISTKQEAMIRATHTLRELLVKDLYFKVMKPLGLY